MIADIRLVAQQLIAAGYDPVPLSPGMKDAYRKAWNDPSHRAIPTDFGADDNIGLRTGVPGTAPDGLILHDIDLDDLTAAIAADILLPDTGMISGRPGKARSHRFYGCRSVAPFVKYLGLGGDDDTIVELRSQTKEGKALQTVVPPSIWTDKRDPTRTERIDWSINTGLAGAVAELLTARTRDIATAVLIARTFPGPGNHHDPRLALAGYALSLEPTVIESCDLVCAF